MFRCALRRAFALRSSFPRVACRGRLIYTTLQSNELTDKESEVFSSNTSVRSILLIISFFANAKSSYLKPSNSRYYRWQKYCDIKQRAPAISADSRH